MTSPEYDRDPISLYGSALSSKPTLRTPVDPQQIPRPMLALEHDETKPKRTLPFPYFAQPKLDGFRCLASRYGSTDSFTVRFHSRNSKELQPGLQISLLSQVILKRFPGISFLDGELYSHGKSFEQISSMVKNQSKPQQDDLYYHIYDLYTHKHATFEQRRSLLNRIRDEIIEPRHKIQVVPTDVITSPDSLARIHAQNISKSYEGTMLRDPQSLYLPGKRSPGLLKKKDWHDHEFQIKDITEGKGKNEGAAIFECYCETETQRISSKRQEHKTFSVTAQGPYPLKRQIYRKRQFHIGRYLQVRYQNLTDDGKPRFPEALRFAEEKEP